VQEKKRERDGFRKGKKTLRAQTPEEPVRRAAAAQQAPTTCLRETRASPHATQSPPAAQPNRTQPKGNGAPRARPTGNPRDKTPRLLFLCLPNPTETTRCLSLTPFLHTQRAERADAAPGEEGGAPSAAAWDGGVVAEEGGAPRAPRLGRRRSAAPRAQARSVSSLCPFTSLTRMLSRFCSRALFRVRSEASDQLFLIWERILEN
jgi:hypothetical protein